MPNFASKQRRNMQQRGAARGMHKFWNLKMGFAKPQQYQVEQASGVQPQVDPMYLSDASPKQRGGK